MGNLVNLISGKKTYASVAALVAYRVAVKYGLITDIPGADEVLAGSVLVFLRTAVAKVEAIIKPE